MPAAIKLVLYNPETQEEIKTLTRTVVPWKMLKQSVRLNKLLGSKDASQFEESDIDAISQFVIGVFGNGLTIEMLDEQSDIAEMMAVLVAIVSRAKGIMDPTSPKAVT